MFTLAIGYILLMSLLGILFGPFTLNKRVHFDAGTIAWGFANILIKAGAVVVLWQHSDLGARTILATILWFLLAADIVETSYLAGKERVITNLRMLSGVAWAIAFLALACVLAFA
jgi:hypothetical protein